MSIKFATLAVAASVVIAACSGGALQSQSPTASVSPNETSPETPARATPRPLTPAPTPATSSLASPEPFAYLGDHTIAIGGNDLFVRCVGAGLPAVILIHGLDGSHDVYEEVEPALAETNLVCSFDRVNAGDSPRVPGTRTLTESAAELADFVDVVGLTTPVVLVAASLGGEIALIYAGLHPDSVSGMVLVDAVLPLETELIESDPSVTSIAQLRSMLNNNGEHLDYYGGYAEAAAVLDDLPIVPITYMSALGHDWPNWSAGIDLYTDLLTEFVEDLPDGKLVFVDSGHDIQWERPETVVDETRLILERIASQ